MKQALVASAATGIYLVLVKDEVKREKAVAKIVLADRLTSYFNLAGGRLPVHHSPV